MRYVCGKVKACGFVFQFPNFLWEECQELVAKTVSYTASIFACRSDFIRVSA